MSMDLVNSLAEIIQTIGAITMISLIIITFKLYLLHRRVVNSQNQMIISLLTKIYEELKDKGMK